MRIAINAWFWDNGSVGSGQYLKGLLPALLEADNSLEIILISSKPFNTKPEKYHYRVKFHTAKTPFPVQSSNMAKVWFEQIAFPRACNQLGVDVAHIPYFGSPLSINIPTVVTVHDLIPMILLEYRGGLLARLYSSLAAASASRADIILTDSEYSRQDILQKLAVPAEKTRVVYLAPAPQFQPPENQQQIFDIRKKYNLPEDFVLYLGGYDVRKNLTALLYAYTWVSSSLGGQYPLVLAGKLPKVDTPLFPDPVRIARKVGIEEHIITPGWIAEADLPLLYSAATLFVYPSRYEGFGLPVLEAMACATPVVTTNATSIPELAGTAAFQADPDDTKLLAAPIIQLCVEDETNEEMVERGLAQVKKFTWHKTAKETLQAYRDVLDGNKKRM